MSQENKLPPVENDYTTPNGLHFKISVIKGFGKWHCRGCGQDGYTNNEYGDDAERQAKLHAREHSVICGAGRGSKQES